ncbi:ABC transporter G family member 31 like [Actinidia chinensis var. chinensis]|uniref:ABC transporter G family member 31 like n=1 Tax=Actinidia chinensis var. chinensis TaxID=1590841 RepID=A0A2R6P6B1_ACTCC|nr:ABC transporter G family member 31 like [Actinidia chinensis var. chinensis]
MAASNGSEYFELDMEAGIDTFTRASNAQSVREDEDELLWAALARLPSQKRTNFALLRRTASESDSGEERTETVDVRKLDRLNRELVVKRALATSEQDNYKLLSAIKKRLDTVGIEVPKVEVRFKNLNITANVQVGSRALPTLVNNVRDHFERILTGLHIFRPKRHHLPILNDISGFVKPGRMTLLLGPPGSGKSTLLLALAGKLDPALKKSGTITYNGHKLDDFYVQRTSAYISQTDNHIAELTVRETLDFAARCQGSGEGFAGYMEDLTRLEKERNIHPSPEIDAFMKVASSVGGRTHSVSTDYILKVLGLDVCSDTLVGNDMLRGVSGGQRKRVTTGEMIVGPRKTLFMDEISTGLDSSTTYQIVKCIRNFVHLMEGTVLMSLLQPAPETFDLFDDLVLLSDGYLVYQGPREQVLEFFESLGFQLPPRKGVADFLQEVTSKKDQAQYWADSSKPYGFLPVSKIAEAFKNSKYGRSVDSSLYMQYDKSKDHPSSLSKTKFSVSKQEIFRTCFSRELLLISRHRFLYTFRTCQVAFVGFVTCTLFLRTRIHPTDEANGNLYLSCLFFGLIHMMFNGLSELPLMVFRLPVFYKQRDNFFHPAWAWSLASWILRVPYSVIEAVVWSCVVYYTVGFAPGAGRFFRYMFLLFSVHQMALGLFRMMASLARDLIIANTFGSATLLVIFLLGGFILPKAIKKARAVIPNNAMEENSVANGVLTALVGSSGAGKTTLMDVLAGRKTGGYIEGDIRISGYPKEQRTFARISGYVEQNDIHSPQVTVLESLLFSSSLRLPKEVNKEKRHDFVEEVMRLVELDTLRHALVGLPGSSGLSTEQRKRLTIAVELVSNPSIIFMDEPTSGLDARAAAIVMRTVRNTVDTGRTVVCTIHQPSIDIFEAFDELLLMKRGGRVIYGGKLGENSQTMIDYFQYILMRIGQDFAEIYKNSQQFRGVEASIERASVPPPNSTPLKFDSTYSQSAVSQFRYCLWKQNLVYWRSPSYNVVRLFFTTLSGLLLGSIFWGVGSKRDSTQNLYVLLGALYASCLFVGISNSSSVQPIVSIERTVFYRERAAGMYAPFPYAASQALVEIPYIAVQTILFGIITYFMMDFERTIGKFFLYLLFMFLTFTYFTLYGMMAVGLTPSQHLAAVISSAFYSLWNLLSGFLIPKPNIPGWWIWFYYICPISWTLRGAITSQLGDVDTMVVGPGFKGSVKEYIEVSFGYGPGMMGVTVAVLLGFCAFFFTVFAISVRVLNFQKR